jgi:hypothetical protein
LNDNHGKSTFYWLKKSENLPKMVKNSKMLNKQQNWMTTVGKYFFALKNLGKFPIKFEKDWTNYLMLGKHGRLMTTVGKKTFVLKNSERPQGNSKKCQIIFNDYISGKKTFTLPKKIKNAQKEF